MAALSVTTSIEVWPLREAFVISRGAKTSAVVVVVTVTDGEAQGRGECVPYARYGETPEGVERQIAEAVSHSGFTSRDMVQSLLPAGAARNALDCALWDLEAKRTAVAVSERAGGIALGSLETCYTLSLGSPGDMARAALAVPQLKLLKLKLGGLGDDLRMEAVRDARPDARLVADANEAWTEDLLEPLLGAAQKARFELIEQPLPQGSDTGLERVPHLVPICADESVHTSHDLAALPRRYDAVNIKLDKAGGLTEALLMARRAKELGLKIMVGSMVSTSLSVAPAFLVGQGADWVDLDGPLLLAQDREPGIASAGGILSPPPRELWG